jgi:hypothetical protein
MLKAKLPTEFDLPAGCRQHFVAWLRLGGSMLVDSKITLTWW